jgi:hypothetical protein
MGWMKAELFEGVERGKVIRLVKTVEHRPTLSHGAPRAFPIKNTRKAILTNEDGFSRKCGQF